LKAIDPMDKDTRIIQARKEKITAIKEMGVPLYPNDFKISCTVAQLKQTIDKDPSSLGEDGPVFKLAGRMMAVNKMGKSSFVRFKDGADQMQAISRKTRWEMTPMTCSKNWISVISSV
jgi:lysyl-tRNA synthetase, class II